MRTIHPPAGEDVRTSIRKAIEAAQNGPVRLHHNVAGIVIYAGTDPDRAYARWRAKMDAYAARRAVVPA